MIALVSSCYPFGLFLTKLKIQLLTKISAMAPEYSLPTSNNNAVLDSEKLKCSHSYFLLDYYLLLHQCVS